jgi:acetyltransferase
MDLTPLMKPASIAIVGASARMGRGTRVVANLQQLGYRGRVFPVNPKYGEILGLPCYPDVLATPEPAELVVVAIPAADVPELLAAAVTRGTRAAIILSSGFGEAGPEGRERQAALERLVTEHSLLICGPNCYGVFDVRRGSATFSADFTAPPPAGGVAVVSQSGGFSHAIAETLYLQRALGLSYIVSCGNQAGVCVEDYLEFLVADPDTRVIGVFVEGFRRPAKLRHVAAQALAAGKPIVALKVGQSENARQAMLSHTGSLAGTPEIVAATLRHSGIATVSSLNEMIDTLTLLAAPAASRAGGRVAVLSGLGGECGRVADAAERAGLELPPLTPATVDALRRALPDFGTPRNPLDGTGGMYEDPAIFPGLIDALLGAPDVDVVAVNLRANVPKPGGWAPSRQFAGVIRDRLAAGTDKLVVAFGSFSGGDLDQEVVRPLAEAGVPYLDGTETAMLALAHARDRRRFVERHPAWDDAGPSTTPPAGRSPRSREAGPGSVMPTLAAERLLREAGILLVATSRASSADAAAREAERLGYPVVLKIDSPDLPHKTDVGGIRVGCATADAVGKAFEEMVAQVRTRAPAARIDGALVQPMVAGGVEMVVGIKRDPLFGPAVVCGFGGILVEILRDVAVRVPPFDHAEAREMLDELRGRALLHGARGRPPADTGALADLLVRLGALAAGRDDIRAIDLNPVLVLEGGRGAVAVDWLIELD